MSGRNKREEKRENVRNRRERDRKRERIGEIEKSEIIKESESGSERTK